jgi:hypothetical protein
MLCCGTTAALANDDWPRELSTESGTLVMYQPQIESFEDGILTLLAAMSFEKTGSEAPTFGSMLAAGKVDTDRDARVATLTEFSVEQVLFPHAAESDQENIRSILDTRIAEADMTMSLDRFLAALDAAEREQELAQSLQTDPPNILYASEPTVLITIDGDPELRKIEDSDFMRVINSPFFIGLDMTSQTYYLRGGPHWYEAAAATGPFSPTTSQPALLDEMVPYYPEEDDAFDPDAEPSAIIVSTEPAELLMTDGEPNYSPIAGTGLLYVSNSEDDVFMSIEDQTYYVLLSGRWYTGTPPDWNWRHVAPDALPADFAKIEAGSSQSHVLPHVAGTDEAREAVLDAQIPQTAAVKRDGESITVEYDGEPQWEPIEDVEASYAVNSPQAVFKVGDTYYCCQEAVWYESTSPTGPWTVCTEVPEVLYSIPPSNPHYNVTYVKVYDYTPSVVYVGYTPGYVGCYPYHGVVWYGTGYYYRPYIGPRYCYPRPRSWGFGVRYNPWTGNWGFAVGSRGPYGWVGFGKSSWTGNWYGGGGSWWGGGVVGGGWWGAGGYRDVNVNINRNIINTGNRVNIYNRNNNINRNQWASIDRRPNQPVARPGDRANIQPTSRIANRPSTRPNTGQLPSTRPTQRPGTGQVPTTRPATRPSTGQLPTTRPATRPSTGQVPTTRPTNRAATQDLRVPQTPRQNNVVADRSGNVYRRSTDGWQGRDSSGWSNTRPSPSTTQKLNRQYDARQRGTQRTNTRRSTNSRSGYSSTGRSGYSGASRGGYSRGGGGARGGGGRRR